MAALSLTRWNWQRPDWPRFRWDIPRLARAEECFAREAGVFLGVFQHLDRDDRDRLVVESLTGEALTTSAIEGEILDRASVQSSIRKHLGLAADRRKVKPAELGIAQMTVDQYRRFSQPLTHEMLFSWNRMLLHEGSGRYRTGPEPMQVISGPIHSPQVHFEAPPAARVHQEMEAFLDWFTRTAPGAGNMLPPLTRAGTAHLYFVSVHPFEDGNGRVGRAVAEKALSQAMGQPLLTALAATIMSRRKAYYDALEAANKYNEVTAWLRWFAATAIDAQRQAVATVEFLVEKARLLTRLRGRLNPRQEKALLRMLREGPAGFRGGLSAGNYMRITGASPATATRDLAGMVTLGALSRTGEVRHARYWATIAAKTPHPYQD